MRDFDLYGAPTSESQHEQDAIRAYNEFADWRVFQVDLGNGRPRLVTRRLRFSNHLPVSIGIYPIHCESTLVKLNKIQDMLIQVGFMIREMRRRHLRGESDNDGKIYFLHKNFQNFAYFLRQIWRDLRTPGRLETGTRFVGLLVQFVDIMDEMAEFVMDMDLAGVEFKSEEWNEAAEVWTEELMEEEDWLREGNWRHRFCEILKGTRPL